VEQRSEASVSVRNLVEFIMRSGDIDSGFVSSSRAVEGTRGHQRVQSQGGDSYTPEVSINYIFHGEAMDIEVTGRIDGVIEENGRVIIDEIKTTTREIMHIEEDYNPRHWAQAKCYGYIYAAQRNIKTISIRLTYYNIESEQTRHFEKEMKLEELERFFNSLLKEYEGWAEGIANWQSKRNESIKGLTFPFESYRKGQKDLAVAVYKTIKRENKLFAQAPTGTGKTMAVLFPSIKAQGEGFTSKIFYLTAKTITRTVAENTIQILRNSGLNLRSIILTAKEKICFNSGSACNPVECEYASGHFDRINAALHEILKEQAITRDKVEIYARKHRVCPFEFSLDISLFSDVIICDYNYLFDPRASLKRFFGEGKGDFVFLVDEAHNLVDRSREMFSAKLLKGDFMDIRTAFKEVSKELYKVLGNINKYFIEINKEVAGMEYMLLDEKPKELYKLLKGFTKIAEEKLAGRTAGQEWNQLMDLYFEVLSFQRIYELYGDNYTTFIEGRGRDLTLKLLCLDPSKVLKSILESGRSSILFSATLTPMNYYNDILGGDGSSYRIKLLSPFPEENLCVLLDNNISTRYSNREESYEKVAEDIFRILYKKGNYFVFFPSYKYMNEVYKIFINMSKEMDIILQRPDMNEIEREEFLSKFNLEGEKTLVGFAVMGGIFGEGIDLSGDRLIGAVIVGVGLPQISSERNIMKNYFDRTRGSGFEYAYVFPGMNRVMQAAGRVIRTESDRGVVLLIDDRFTKAPYRDLLPREWNQVRRIKRSDDIEMFVESFWGYK
jgi:DNA excision repair protein ERCC-2